MENERIREFIAYYQDFRAQLRGDLRDYESGKHFTSELRDSKRVDTTPQTIAELKRRLAKIENLIAAYEALLHA